MIRLNSMFRLVPLIVVLIITVGLSTADGQRNNRNNRNNNRNDQVRNQQRQLINRGISAHKQAAERAKNIHAAASRTAQGAAINSQSAHQEVQTAALTIANLETQVEFATDGLRQVEQLVIESHEEDSKLKLAIADVELKQQQYADIRRKLLKSPSYKAAYQRALSSINKAQELPAVRRKYIDDHQDLQIAESDLSAARQRLETTRTEILGATPEWTAAVDEVRTAKAALVAAEIDLKNGLLGKTSASSIYRNAASTAAAAAGIAARSEARIKSLQAQQKRISEQQRRANQNNNRNNRSGSRN